MSKYGKNTIHKNYTVLNIIKRYGVKHYQKSQLIIKKLKFPDQASHQTEN
jgi:hypothetical protein